MNYAPALRPMGWLGAALLLSASLLALSFVQRWYLREYVYVFLFQMVVYGGAAWLLLKGKLAEASRERQALIAILLIAAALRGIALFAPQAMSTDIFRYVWDGRVQGAGINPYQFIPADPTLAALRDTAVYPNINRADYAHTIYPPFAQIIYFFAHSLHDSVLMMKLVMVAFDGLTIACLIGLLKQRGLPSTRVLLYAWHPLPVWEFAGAGHIDAAAIAMIFLAMLLAMRRAPVWAAIALAAGTLTKYYPLVIAPALYQPRAASNGGRERWLVPLVFALTVFGLYLPYLGVGKAVLGFMPDYANEEGLNTGSGFFVWLLLHELVPATATENALAVYLPFAATVMAVVALWAMFARRVQAISIDAALLLATAFTVLFSPHFAWYFAWLVPFLCFRFSLGHVWLTGACVLIYALPAPFDLGTHALLYAPFLALLLAQFLYARRKPLALPTDMEIPDASHARSTIA